MRLWDWAVQAYGAPGVERLCLELQDLDGQSVCFLLWAAWAAMEGRLVGTTTLDAAAVIARPWDDRALKPLRAARHGMKPAAPGLDDNQRLALRGQLQAIELAAERLLLEALEAQTPAGRRRPARDLAERAGRGGAWPGTARRPKRLAALADAFSRA